MQKCPICNEPLGRNQRGPFCSPRCRNIDLGKWLGGDYVISRPLDVTDLDEDLVHGDVTGESS